MEYFNINTINSLNEGFLKYITPKVKSRTTEQYTTIVGHYLRNQVLNKVEQSNFEDIFDPSRIIAFHNYRKSKVVQAAIRNFLEFLKQENKIDDRFPLDYPNIKRPERKKGDFLSIPAIQYIFSDNVEFDSYEEKIVAPCIYSLHFFCCFEQKHIINLKTSDLLIEERLIRNMRCGVKYPNLLQWIELNDITVSYLKKYLEYRKEINPQGDSLLCFEGRPIDTDSINALFHVLARKNNMIHIDSNVYGQLLVRSMILYSLVSTGGKSISQVLQFQEWNEQVKQAYNEFLSNYMRIHNKDDVQKQFSLYEILTGYLNEEEAFDNDDYENYENNEDKNDDTQGESLLIFDHIRYSEENDLQMEDLFGFDGISHNNLMDKEVTIQRLVRNSKIAKSLKEHYSHRCQLCGYRLRSSNGEYMSEAHHLKPYNRKHRGDDSIKNIIILCPNCHSQFDELYYAINPETNQVHCTFEDDQYHLSELEMLKGHELGKEYLTYTWELFQQKKYNIVK